MNLWLLLLLPVWIFVATALFRLMLVWLEDRDEWWVFPFYMAVGVPLFFGTIWGILFIGGLSFGVVSR